MTPLQKEASIVSFAVGLAAAGGLVLFGFAPVPSFMRIGGILVLSSLFVLIYAILREVFRR